MKRLSLDVTSDQLAAIDVLCKRWSCTRSQLLERALRKYIARQRDVYALDQAIREALPI